MKRGAELGPYEVVEPLGEGGMGEVYLARDTRLGREVALKLLPERFASDPERLARFEREARAAAALNHPHIAVVHDVGLEAGTHFIVQEYLEGSTLRAMLDEGGALPLGRALELAAEIAEALAAAHGAGIIHRDLKPENVFVTGDGHAKVLDFGLAKLTPSSPAASSVAGATESPTVVGTAAGQVMGTAGYMAPEQVAGAAEIDRRADLFAFGCVLYEMLTGSRAFAGRSVMQTLDLIAHEEPEPLSRTAPGLPARLAWIVAKALAKDPDRRYQHADDLLVDLVRLARDVESGAARSFGSETTPAAGGAARGVPIRIAAPIAAIVALGAAMAGWLLTSTFAGRPGRDLTITLQARMMGVAGDQRARNIALSPDGAHLAYVVDDPAARTSGVYVRPLDQPEGRFVTSAAAGVAGAVSQPFFSPDGEWVGYASQNEIRKVRVTGGASQTVASVDGYVAGAAWAANDDIIVGLFASTEGLQRVPADGGPPQSLTSPREGAYHMFPQVLPGGRRVLFTSFGFSPVRGNVEILDLDTNRREVVQGGAEFGHYLPTGHLVYFEPGQSTLFAVPFDPWRLEKVGPSVAVVDGVSRGPFEIAFSDRGLLAFLPEGDDDLLYPVVWVDRDGNAEPLWEEPGRYYGPRLSPDGTELALVVGDGNRDVWVYDLTVGVPARVTRHGGGDDHPVWAPDGQVLAFSSRREGDAPGISGIYRTRADGSGVAEVLVESEHLAWPYSWSAEGDVLVYGEQRPQTLQDIFALSLGQEREAFSIAATGAREEFAALSPDGRWLAYTSTETGRPEVFVRPFPPAPGQQRVSSDGGSQPRWAGDGRELFYRTDSGIMVVPVDAGAEPFSFEPARELFSGDFLGGVGGIPAGGPYYSDYDVTADGQRFVMFPDPGTEERLGDRAHVTLVVNWFEELERLAPAGR